MRNHKTIDTQMDGLSYDSMTVMGHEVWQALGDDVYIVGFTAHEGEWGQYRVEPANLAPPPPGSFDDLFGRTNFDNAFLDFRGRGADGEWLSEPRVMRPLGNGPMVASWPKVLDAVVFTRVMYPSTPAGR